MKQPSKHSARAAERRRRAEDDELGLRVQQRTAELAEANEALRSEITGHERAEEDIQDLSKFPSENPNPVLRIARDGTLLYVNEAGLTLLPQWHLEVGETSPPMLREAAFQSLDDGSTRVLEFEHGERAYSFHVAPVVVAGYANLYGLDIIERKRAEAGLRESEAKLRTLFEILPVGVSILDAERKISVVNPALEKILDIPRASLLKGEYGSRRYLKPDGRPMPADEFASATVLREQKAVHNVEIGVVKENGEVIWVSVSAAPVAFPDWKVLVVTADITERKRAEERMETFSHEIIAAREEERKRVSSSLHHDVGSLAVGMSAHLDAIEADLRSGKPGEALAWMKRTRKLFDESVVNLKGLAAQLRPPELDVLGLGAALRQHFSQVTKHGDTRIHFKETLGRRRVSENTGTSLFRIAQEALTNAIVHGGAKKVDVRLTASKEKIRLTLRDNGKGFDPSEQRVRATPRTGLRVMKEMAAAAGGAFTIDSVQGKGTTVRVDLPLKTADSQKERAHEHSRRHCG